MSSAHSEDAPPRPCASAGAGCGPPGGQVGLDLLDPLPACAGSRRRRRHAAGLEGPGGGLGGFVGWSVLLSIGLGMLSGSIQHFIDFPRYAAVLLPLGVPVSLAAYMGRERLSPPRPTLLRLGAAVAAAVLVLAFGLDILADELAPHDH